MLHFVHLGCGELSCTIFKFTGDPFYWFYLWFVNGFAITALMIIRICTCMIYVVSKECSHICLLKGNPMDQILLYGNFSHIVYDSTAVYVPLSAWSDTTFKKCWNILRIIILSYHLLQTPNNQYRSCAWVRQKHVFFSLRACILIVPG